jgi:hypothetical protein
MHVIFIDNNKTLIDTQLELLPRIGETVMQLHQYRVSDVKWDLGNYNITVLIYLIKIQKEITENKEKN